MKTPRCIIFIIMLAPLITCSKGFTIKGNITGIQVGTVSLAYVNADGEDTTISSPVNAGAFAFAPGIIIRLLVEITIVLIRSAKLNYLWRLKVPDIVFNGTRLYTLITLFMLKNL